MWLSHTVLPNIHGIRKYFNSSIENQLQIGVLKSLRLHVNCCLPQIYCLLADKEKVPSTSQTFLAICVLSRLIKVLVIK